MNQQRHVGLLQIHEKKFNMTKLPLTTVRPFLIEELELATVPGIKNEPDVIEKILTDKVCPAFFACTV